MSNREAFLAEAKAAREARKADRDREVAVTKIQSIVRGWLQRKRLEKETKTIVDQLANRNNELSGAATDSQESKPTAIDLYNITQRYLAFSARSLIDDDKKCDPDDLDRFERLCRIISDTLKEESPKYSFISIAINKDKSKARSFIEHLKRLLAIGCKQLNIKSNGLRLDNRRGQKISATLLSLLLFFTNTNTWQMLQNPKFSALTAGMKILCRTLLEHLVNNGQLFQNLKSFLLFGTAKGGKVVLPKTSLVAAMTLAVRPVIETNFIEKTVSLFLLHILSGPGLVDHLEQMASIEILNGALFHEEYNIAWRCIRLLASEEQQIKIHFNALEGSYALCLTANLTHLISIHARQKPVSNDDIKETSYNDLANLSLIHI